MIRWRMSAILALTAIGFQGCTASEELRSGSAPLAAAQVTSMYSGRTWKWDPGGAYFAPDNEFRAVSTDESGRPGFVVGEWWATDTGLLCFSGTWRFVGRNSFSSTCFGHRLVGDKVYQREEPAGSWYLFRSEPPHPDDPFREVVAGDRISARLEIVRASCRSPFAECPVSLETPPVDNPLPADEIRRLFSDRTWQWPTGGAYFGPGGWYEAWAADQFGRPGWSIGRWTTDSGLLCMKGPWTMAGETTEDERCFAFRQEYGTIFQRVQPAGEWFVFKAATPTPEDEYGKLTKGNLVDREVEELRAGRAP